MKKKKKKKTGPTHAESINYSKIILEYKKKVPYHYILSFTMQLLQDRVQLVKLAMISNRI